MGAVNTAHPLSVASVLLQGDPPQLWRQRRDFPIHVFVAQLLADDHISKLLSCISSTGQCCGWIRRETAASAHDTLEPQRETVGYFTKLATVFSHV